jgi:hypothetical protein
MFYVPDQNLGQVPPGTLIRIVIETPFHRQANDRQGRVVSVPDQQRTWAWLMQQAQIDPGTYRLPSNMSAYVINTRQRPDVSVPTVFCLQPSPLYGGVQQQQMPFGQQAGAGMQQQQSVFRTPTPKGTGGPSDYDVLPESVMTGDMDDPATATGTVTDVDDKTGMEVQRGLFMPQAPRPMMR